MFTACGQSPASVKQDWIEELVESFQYVGVDQLEWSQMDGIAIATFADGDRRDDLSREDEGICVFKGILHRYRYPVMNRLLSEREALRAVFGSDHVDSCHAAHRFIAAKNHVSLPEVPDSVDDAADQEISRQDAIAGGSFLGDTTGGRWAVKLYGGADCSGVLINERFVLTNAHCTDFSNGFDFQVKRDFHSSAGTDYCLSGGSPSLNCNSISATVYEHPDYSGSGDWDDDVSVVYLSSDLSYSGTSTKFYNGTLSAGNWMWLYGNGRTTCTSSSVYLKSGNFEIDHSGTKRARTNINSSAQVCSGDSGAGYSNYYSSRSDRLVLALHAGSSNKSCGSPGFCTVNNDDGWGPWIYPKKSWIFDKVTANGGSCFTYTSGSPDYFYCVH